MVRHSFYEWFRWVKYLLLYVQFSLSTGYFWNPPDLSFYHLAHDVQCIMIFRVCNSVRVLLVWSYFVCFQDGLLYQYLLIQWICFSLGNNSPRSSLDDSLQIASFLIGVLDQPRVQLKSFLSFHALQELLTARWLSLESYFCWSTFTKILTTQFPGDLIIWALFSSVHFW